MFALALLAILGVITSLRALSNDRQMLLQKTEELTASLQDLKEEIRQQSASGTPISSLERLDGRDTSLTQKMTDSGTAGEIPVATSSAAAAERPGVAEAVVQDWPPKACTHPEGAVLFFCERPARKVAAAFDLWKEGSQLLGQADFVEFLSRCQRAESVLAGSRVKIWSDSRDRKGFKGAMAEQVRDVYGLSKLVKPSWGDDTWILDVGGNLGITAIHLHIRAPKCKLLTLEPSPWNYILLRLNLLQNLEAAGQTVFALHGGFSATPGTLHGTHMFTNAWGSRNDDIFQPHRSIKGELSKHELGHFTAPLRTLEEVKTNYGIKHIRLMKLDCEGCEWTVGLSMMHNGDWKMVDMLFGELHALCQNDVSDAAECLPRNVSTTAGRDLWYFLCEARKFPLEWGCEEPRFAGLGREVASSLAARICGSSDTKAWQCAWAKKLCKDQGRKAPHCHTA
ncbi:sdnD [Symbiodinium sp. CCMP2592]|nr:sdnD [Symbiodinium sp. CCMP2592]